jgi:leishmanolysin
VYSVTPQVYHEPRSVEKAFHHNGRVLLSVFDEEKDVKQPIRIYLNYDAVGHSLDRDCQRVGNIVKLGEPPSSTFPAVPACNPNTKPPVSGDCWYNCTLDDISGKDKKHRLRKVHLLDYWCLRSVLVTDPADVLIFKSSK